MTDTSIDLPKFYTAIRAPLFGGKLTPDQVRGMDRIIFAGASYDLRWLAYALATAYHETGGKMLPVLENLNYSAAGLRATFPKYFTAAEAERYARKPEAIANRAYANRLGNGDEASGDGFRWRGRGIVQATGRTNYIRYRIASTPEKAMDEEFAVHMLFDGMTNGKYTSLKLSDFFNEKKTDWLGARRIINGTDKASKVAGEAKLFHAALVAAKG